MRRHGMALIYLLVCFALMMGFASLGVDLARVQAAKTELQRATDAAARHGASALRNTIFGVSAAPSSAIAAAACNTVDGQPVVLNNSDITLGIWNTSTHTFAAVSDATIANAVKITAHRTAARGNAIPLYFASLLGISSCDINTSAIAMLNPGAIVNTNVPATSNPFLAGMPAGSSASMNNPHNSPDYAPQACPVHVTGFNLTPGSSMSFDGINGGANNFHTSTLFSADGNFSWMVSNYDYNENGMANMVSAPINCLVGVFLDDSQPNMSSTPANLNYSTTDQRDFAVSTPALKQIFFIGDGRRDNGEVQQFVVPRGATRFYLATWDGFEWNNNVGSFNATVHNSGSVTLVQ